MEFLNFIFITTSFFIFSWKQLFILGGASIFFIYCKNNKSILAKKFNILNIMMLIYYIIVQSLIICIQTLFINIQLLLRNNIFDKINNYYLKTKKQLLTYIYSKFNKEKVNNELKTYDDINDFLERIS